MAAGRTASESELRGRLPEGFHLSPNSSIGSGGGLRGMEANTNVFKGMKMDAQCGTWCESRDIATSEYPAKDIRRERPTESAGLMRDGGIY